MANYNELKTAIQQAIRTNGNNEITGALLQQSLLSMINSLGAGYQFMGVATLDTTPGTPDQKVFYIAGQAGTYIMFGGITISDGEIAVLKYDSSWSKETIIADLESKFNKTTELTNDDTDDKYPSAPAVVNYVEEKIGTVFDIILTDREKDKFVISDKEGNVIAQVTEDGIKTTKYNLRESDIHDDGRKSLSVIDSEGFMGFSIDSKAFNVPQINLNSKGGHICWIDDDFLITNSEEFREKYEEMHDWCVARGIYNDFALIPDASRVDTATAWQLEGFHFLMHPSHPYWYDAADQPPRDVEKAKKSLIECQRFFHENMFGSTKILVYPGSSASYADNIAFLKNYIECGINSNVFEINSGAFIDPLKFKRISAEAVDQGFSIEQIKDKIYEGYANGDWVIIGSHIWTADEQHEFTLEVLKEIIEYANSLSPIRSVESVWDERKIMYNLINKKV